MLFVVCTVGPDSYRVVDPGDTGRTATALSAALLLPLLRATVRLQSLMHIHYPSNSIWPYLSSDLVRSEREYC